MKITSAFALAALLVLPVRARALSVDFDGSSGGSFSLPAFTASRRPRRTPPPAPAPAPAASGAVSFHGAALPPVLFSRTDRIPESLVSAIDATHGDLRLALYELSLPGVADALVRAKRRGVNVALIYDWKHGNSGGSGFDGGGSQPGAKSGPSAQLSQLVAAGIPVRLLKGGGSWGIMHNKFAVFDGELVETGSFNWTTAADQNNFENAVFRDDASLASLYRAYWDYMWKLATPIDQPYQAPSSFGAPPSDPAPSVSFNGGTWPRVIFSPQGGTEARLIDAINHCHATLDVAIFSLYSQPVADAVLAARARGVTVRVIADASQARRSAAVGSLVAQGVDLRLSAGRGGAWGVTHHKFAVFDGRMVATGSYNFSQNAEQFNFENQFFSADGGDAAAFETEFAAVWAQAHAPASGDVPAAGVALR